MQLNLAIFGENDKNVIACNTAHVLLPELSDELGLRFQSLIEATTQFIAESNVQRIVLLASPTTIRTKLYEKPLRMQGIEVLLPSQAEMIQIEKAIRSVISGMKPCKLQNVLAPIIANFTAQGAQAVLLGCTELSTIFPESPKLINPLEIITKNILENYYA